MGYNQNGFFTLNTDLRGNKGSMGQVAITLGQTTIGDFLGGLFYWDTNSVVSDDNMNIFAVDGVATGRWIRSGQKVTTYPQGTLFRVGALKVFAGESTTLTGGTREIFLTQNNLDGGVQIFSGILFNIGQVYGAAANSYEVAYGQPTAETLERTTYKFSRGTVLGILGATILNLDAGKPFRFLIIGI